MTAPTPRKSPRQQRAHATCAAILEATARILESAGPEALTTNRIAEVAGVSIGSLYQYYPAKQAILAELVRAQRAALLTDLQDAVQQAAGLDLRATVPLLIAASLKHHAHRPLLAQRLEAAEKTLALDAETAALKAQIDALVVKVLAQRGVADPRQAAFDLAAMVTGWADAAVMAGDSDTVALAERMTRAANGYLGLAPGSVR
ncbi:TetR/AcrR family transcriptional regulator [Pararhodobacter zhoushanensis]|uniref:TetR/AcrR family transcriptional regulator n=1 Tax=Pararhodobacter zhoushanensis TaxID=2479545 RepID=UPI000F8EA3C9|nr:TetR/AcrR family transcriptional regulator [Pararhodobacter zhoushanensis]